VELQYRRVAERHKSNTADSWTASDAVNVQRLDKLPYELSQALEVVKADATRRVQSKHDVSAVRTSCGATR